MNTIEFVDISTAEDIAEGYIQLVVCLPMAIEHIKISLTPEEIERIRDPQPDTVSVSFRYDYGQSNEEFVKSLKV